jgi:D-amino-acid dehydrogenase
MRLDDINIKKEFDTLMKTYRPFSEIAQEEVILGKDNLL